jgi:hypothetical protein
MPTFLSWPPVARSFPSDEKWQQLTLPVLARAFATSEKLDPAVETMSHVLNLIQIIAIRQNET